MNTTSELECEINTKRQQRHNFVSPGIAHDDSVIPTQTSGK